MDLSYFSTHQSDVLMYFGQHVKLTLVTLIIAMAIALPVGTIMSRIPVLYTPVLLFFGLVYTIPSLALLAALLQLIDPGFWNAIIALVAYAQFILLRNIFVGLRGVDPVVIDAARGMGMNSWQILLRIEFPLALPVILAGVRIATVATIAIATIAELIDAGGLGTLLFDGIGNGSNSEIEVGAVAVSLLAIIADIILRLIDRSLPATRAGATQR